MADDTTQRPRNAAATREALLQVARTMLAERGATQTTTRDIAAEVGVNQALINRYFGSKENLFIEAVRSGGAGVADLLAAVPLDELPTVLLRHVLEVSVTGRGNTALLAGVVNNETITEVIRDMVARTFTEGLGPRLGGSDDAALRAELLNALVVGIVVMRQKIGSPALAAADIDDIATHVSAMAQPLLERSPESELR